MDEIKNFADYLQKYKIDDTEIKFSLDIVKRFQKYQQDNNSFSGENIQDFAEKIISKEDRTVDAAKALARWLRFNNQEEDLIYILTLFNSLGVLETIIARLKNRIDLVSLEKLINRSKLPAFGSKINAYPPVTNSFLIALQEILSEKEIKEILSGNNHQIPLEVFNKDKKLFQQLENIDLYLEKKHQEMIEEMEKCYYEGILWFEQKITLRVIDFVKANQEVSTGIRKGDYIYITKILYKATEFLTEKDIKMKRYLYCHCPFVRTSILDDQIEVPDLWCYCSSGFAKTRFEVIFDQTVEIELLESVLSGGDKCRFRIKVPKK